MENPGSPVMCSAEHLRDILGDPRGGAVANKGGRGARAVVLGLGHFGGGEGAARFLAGRGWAVLVTDLKSADELARAIGRLSDLPIEYRLGGHRPEDLLGADLVVVNPAVPRTAPILGQARSAGVALSSSMNLFLALCPAPVAAVTGSTGKSTTAAMLAGMLAQTGRRVHLGGNIGVSLLPVLDQMRPEDMVVLEISCFQLEDAGCLPWSPSVAVVTNLTPNHLDRYGTPEAYAAAKRPIVGFQSRADVAVLNHRDPVLRGWARTEVRGSLLLFDPLAGRGPLVTGTNLRCGRIVWNNGAGEQVICAREHVRLPGEHNVANAMAACAAARWLGTEARQIREALCAFSGLEHRLEECGRFGGMKFYNDSDATTPESTIAALRSFERPMTLIAGGYSKGLDLGPMAAAIAARADALVTIGHCGPELAQLSREAGLRRGKAAAIREAGSLGEAVRAAIELSMPGSVILFSPGCASFDMFQNFAERGLVFKALVEEEGQRE